MLASFVVIYDACVLYPLNLRDLLMHIATTGTIIQARWSEKILSEWVDSLLADRPDLKRENLQRTCSLMNEAVTDCLVTGYENLVSGLQLPDENDRHVLAAAIRAGAQSIPEDELSKYNVRAVHPDDFVRELLEMSPGTVLEAYRKHEETLRRPPRTREEVLEALERFGMRRSVAALRGFLKS